MFLKSEQEIEATFFITDPNNNGELVDADSTPTGVLRVNGIDSSSAVAVSKLSTGEYLASVTLPSLDVSDRVEIIVSATLNSYNGKAKIFFGIVDNYEENLELMIKLLRNAHKITAGGDLYIYDGNDDEAAVLEQYELYNVNGTKTADGFVYIKRIV